MTIRFALPASLGAARAAARAELIKSALETVLGEDVSVELASDYASLVALALAGSVDLLWAPAVVCARLEDEAAIVAKTVRGGHTTYCSALVARRDANLATRRLTGKRAAWVDRTSLGGHLLAVEHLRRLGLSADAVFARQEFVGSYPEAVRSVIDGEADVCAIFVPEDDPKLVERALGLLAGPARAAQLGALFVSDAVPTDAIVVTRSLAEPRRSAVVERLFPFHEARPRPAAFCLAMEVDAFERAQPGEYASLRGLWSAS